MQILISRYFLETSTIRKVKTRQNDEEASVQEVYAVRLLDRISLSSFHPNPRRREAIAHQERPFKLDIGAWDGIKTAIQKLAERPSSRRWYGEAVVDIV